MPRDGEQTDAWGGGFGGLGVLHLYCTGATLCRRGAGPRVVADCGRIPGKRAAELIFQHTAAPTSGPGEGDLPCLTECLLNSELSSTPCRIQPILISTLLLQRQFSVGTVRPLLCSLLHPSCLSLSLSHCFSPTSPLSSPLLPPPLPTA